MPITRSLMMLEMSSEQPIPRLPRIILLPATPAVEPAVDYCI